MRFAEIVTDDEDKVVQLAKDRLNRSKIENEKKRLKVNQAQAGKIKKDIAATQQSNSKESDPDDFESVERHAHGCAYSSN